jgi:hypothetical protein
MTDDQFRLDKRKNSCGKQQDWQKKVNVIPSTHTRLTFIEFLPDRISRSAFWATQRLQTIHTQESSSA